MAKANQIADIETAAYRAVYDLQYATPAAIKYIRAEVPTASFDEAQKVLNKIVRPTKKYRLKSTPAVKTAA